MARILIVDDEDHIRQLIKIVLARAGHAVLEACDGLQGLELALAEGPDLILLDVRMPNMDGVETLRNLKADPRTMSTPVIMVSAYAQQREGLEYVAMGATAYVTKPFNPKDLAARVEQTLAGTQSV